MGKIIPINEEISNLSNFLESFKKEIEKSKVKNIILACKTEDNQVLVGTCNLDFPGKLELISHLQAEAIVSMVENK